MYAILSTFHALLHADNVGVLVFVFGFSYSSKGRARSCIPIYKSILSWAVYFKSFFFIAPAYSFVDMDFRDKSNIYCFHVAMGLLLVFSLF